MRQKGGHHFRPLCRTNFWVCTASGKLRNVDFENRTVVNTVNSRQTTGSILLRLLIAWPWHNSCCIDSDTSQHLFGVRCGHIQVAAKVPPQVIFLASCCASMIAWCTKVRWKSAAMASEITLVIQNAVALNHTCTLDALSSLEKTRIITILTFFHVWQGGTSRRTRACFWYLVDLECVCCSHLHRLRRRDGLSFMLNASCTPFNLPELKSRFRNF